MGQYRYLSSTYDLVLDSQTTVSTIKSEYNHLVKLNKECPLPYTEWLEIIPHAVYYEGHDELIFGTFYIMVYEHQLHQNCLNSVFFSKFGEVHYTSILLDKKSKYYPLCENLTPSNAKSNVRKLLLVSCLRSFAMLSSSIKSFLNPDLVELDLFDETTAGDLANRMKLIQHRAPADIGLQFLQLGFLQTRYINSAVLDIVYSNKSQADVQENNKLVFTIGDQLDQLFDPLTEYSPEPTEKVYQPPPTLASLAQDSDLQKSICQELLQVQINFTRNLVDFLQSYILPLRIKVLNGAVKGYSTARLNLVFPPTIDEITRINCIYLDALKLALPYGSFEVLKASGMTIPYFYKAYMRHELATKNFNANLKLFLKDMDKLQQEPHVVYTKQKMESIIHGSLNLTKLKLILNRLLQLSPGKKDEVSQFLQSAIVTIDSFLKQSLLPYNNRVFTPTGKMLTELASGWPSELQYGWLTRRVVAVYDVENLRYETGNSEVLVIFSDHILFLRLDEDPDSRGALIHTPSVSDVLMHSLINESPVTNIPSLSVNGWANIQDVQTTCYGEDDKLRIMINSVNGIVSLHDENARSDKRELETTRIYRLVGEKKGAKVVELINKLKILNKTQPFHLFKTKKYGLTLYSTAHDFQHYNEELIKSPFVILLKSKVDHDYLAANKIFFALSLSVLNDSELAAEGHYIDKRFNFSRRVVSTDEFSDFLCQLMSIVYERYLEYDINVFDRARLLRSNEESISMVAAYVHEKSRRPPKPSVLPKQRIPQAKKSLDLLPGIRNSSNSSVVYTRQHSDAEKSVTSKGSRKSFSSILRKQPSNEQNKRSNSLVKKISKVFKSRDNLRQDHDRANGSAAVSTKESVPAQPKKQPVEKPALPRRLPSIPTQSTVNDVDVSKEDSSKSQDEDKTKNFKIVDDLPRPLALAQLHTSHSVRKKLSKLMTEIDYNFYADGENNWELMGYDSLQNVHAAATLANTHRSKLRSSITKMIPVLGTTSNVSPQPQAGAKSHNYRQLVEYPSPQFDQSPVMEQFDTAKVDQIEHFEQFNTAKVEQLERFEQFNTAKIDQVEQFNTAKVNDEFDQDQDEIFQTPFTVQSSKFESDYNFEDSFSINFDAIDSDLVHDVNGIEGITTLPHTESNLSESRGENTTETDDSFGQFHDEEEVLSSHDPANDDIIEDEEEQDIIEAVGGEEQFDKCEPQPQQFTYKNADEYDDSTIINQIELENFTASDFTMSSESQEEEEQTPLVELSSYYSPSQIDMLGNFNSSPVKQSKRQQFTSKINIISPPEEKVKKSNVQYYMSKEDSVKFDEPVLRSSSYSYLTGVLNGDFQDIPTSNMVKIEESTDNASHLPDTTVLYDNRLQENLKDSSIRYLAGYIDGTNDFEDPALTPAPTADGNILEELEHITKDKTSLFI